MARYQNRIPLVKSAEETFEAIRQYLFSEGYEYVLYHDEQLFKKGHGVATAPTFIKIQFDQQYTYIEAWLKFAVVPGAYAGEMGLTGVTGFAVKQKLRKRVQMVETIAGGFVPQPSAVSAPAYQTPPAPQVPPTPAPQNGMALCPNCGTKLPGPSAFCPQCGTRLS